MSFDDELGRETALAREPSATSAREPSNTKDDGAGDAQDAAATDDAASTDDADDEALLLTLLAGELPQPPLPIVPPPTLGGESPASVATTKPALAELAELVEAGASGADASSADGLAEGVQKGTTEGGLFDEASFGGAFSESFDLTSSADPEPAAAQPAVEPAASTAPAAQAAALAIALDRAGAAATSPTPATTAVAAAPGPDGAASGLGAPDAIEREVPLSELPRLLAAEVDGFLRMRGRGRHWEAEIRLDPPELGALHVRLELRGHALHGVVRVEDSNLEPELARFLKDLEQQLNRQGGEASFDLGSNLDRRAQEGELKEGAERTSYEALPRSKGGGAGPDADRLVDLLA